MKISLINSLIYTKKYISANMNFSNSLHSNPVSFGNDSFKKNDNAFEETDRLRKRYEKANKDRTKDSSLESQEQRLHDNEKILREYKKINEILDKSDKNNKLRNNGNVMTINFQELKQQPIFYNKPINNFPDNNERHVNINDNKSNKKLLLALGGLAVIGASVLYFSRGKKPSSDTAEKIIDYAKNNLFKYTDVKPQIELLSQNEKFVFRGAITKFKSKPLSFLKNLNNSEENINILDNLFALNEAKANKFGEFPSLLHFSGTDNATRKNVTKIMADFYGAEYKQTKYTKGYLKEFVETLQEYAKGKKPSFLYIDDIEPLIEDLNKAENAEILNNFKNLLKSKTNKTMCVVNKDIDNKLFERKQLNFNFIDSINTQDFSEELSKIADKEYHKSFMLDSEVLKAIGNYVKKINFMGITEKDYKYNILALADNKDNYIDKMFNIITNHTGDKFEKISLGSDLKVVIDSIKARLSKAQELFDRTEHKTFLYIDDFAETISKAKEDTAEFKELSELLNKAKDNHLTIIIDNKNEKQLEKFLANNSNVKYAGFDLESIKTNLFDFESFGKQGEMLKKRLDVIAGMLKIEQAGKKIPKQNGILLYGDADKITKAENIIKNYLDVNLKEAKYDPKQPFESIKKLVAIAEKGEEQFATTKKRTLINLVGWDELLTAEETLANINMIGRFKQFVEHCSERYHTTVLMKTAKPLEDFEEASIGSQRFETLIRLL